MTEYITDFSKHSLHHMEYTRVNEEQAEHVRSVMLTQDCRANFDVVLLPLTTPEERQAAAEEWAAYRQTVAHKRARDMGAVAVFDSRDDDNTPENLLALLENRGVEEGEGFVTHALMRVTRLTAGANTFDLIRGYYNKQAEAL